MSHKPLLFLLTWMSVSVGPSLPACARQPRLWQEEGMDSVLYLNNGKIQIGIDLRRGGAVFHFSESTLHRNLLNHADEGRLVQQSYYGNPNGSTWWNRPWCWNPIQGGGCKGRKARLIACHKSGHSLMAVTEPVQWATDMPATDCIMEEQITLKGHTAHIRYTFRNEGDSARDHAERHQEIPAVFIDWDYRNFVCYNGQHPWTNDTLTRYIPRLLTDATSGQSEHLSESWAAYVNDDDWGIGVYSPSAEECTLYRFGTGPGGPLSGACSYVAPIRKMSVKKGMVYTYDVYLTIGRTKTIRQRFYSIHRKQRGLSPAFGPLPQPSPETVREKTF